MARNNPVQVQVQNRNAKNNNNTNTSGGGGNNRPQKYYGASPKYFKSITPPISGGKCGGEPTSPRMSPSRVTTPPTGGGGGSPRTSPGLLAGHYAGCKFTEPPLPSALPPPPQHWMQRTTTTLPAIGGSAQPCAAAAQPGDQLAQQLKLMLKVQA